MLDYVFIDSNLCIDRDYYSNMSNTFVFFFNTIMWNFKKKSLEECNTWSNSSNPFLSSRGLDESGCHFQVNGRLD